MSVTDATRPAATRIVRLDEICCDRRAFPREGLDPAREEEFAGVYRDELPAGRDPLPPLACVEDRDGRLILFDGWHRRDARQRVVAEFPGQGFDEVPVAVVRADGQEPTNLGFELAIESCAHASRPLTLKERVNAARRLAVIRSDLTAVEIARRTGVSHQTVLRSRGTVAPSANPRAPQRDSHQSRTDDAVAGMRSPFKRLFQYGEPFAVQDDLDSEELEVELCEALREQYPAHGSAWAQWWSDRWEAVRLRLTDSET